jgi:hypothetical protein
MDARTLSLVCQKMLATREERARKSPLKQRWRDWRLSYLWGSRKTKQIERRAK